MNVPDPFLTRRRSRHGVALVAALVGGLALAFALPADAQGGPPPGGHPPSGHAPPPHHHDGHGAPPPPRHGHTNVVVVDRGRPGWWRGHPGFVYYKGPRAGYYFAPGYGYYAVPRAYVHTTWVVGVTFPVEMRRYVVVNPAGYGLAPPPPGYGWYFAGTNFVLIRQSSGVIVQSVAGGW